MKNELKCFFVVLILVVSFTTYRNFKASNHPVVKKVSLKEIPENSKRNELAAIEDGSPSILHPPLLPNNICIAESLLTVVVSTKSSHFDERLSIRETWGLNRTGLNVYFLVGMPENSSEQVKISQEYEKYDDIIQETFLDTYRNLTLKSIAMLSFFNNYCSDSSKYLLKIDDDVFLNINILLNEVKTIESNNTKDLLTGYIYSKTSPIRNKKHKWYISKSLYSDSRYPDYICGAAYLMSAQVAGKLYKCVLETPMFPLEDVYVTGICAKKAGVIPKRNKIFTCKYVNLKYDNFDKYANMGLVHEVKPQELRKIYKRISPVKLTTVTP